MSIIPSASFQQIFSLSARSRAGPAKRSEANDEDFLACRLFSSLLLSPHSQPQHPTTISHHPELAREKGAEKHGRSSLPVLEIANTIIETDRKTEDEE